ncbi:MAG: hypothetical protein M1823_004706 [Watsoniomyces obsoletus]|nr:MAG: hypothetical protein M1823_004706 [Watsoniomyces obsoletus]
MASRAMMVVFVITLTMLRLPVMVQGGYLGYRESESSCGNPKTVYITIDGNGFFPPILRRDVGTIDNAVMLGTASAPMMATTTAFATITETITSEMTVVTSVTEVITLTEGYTYQCSPHFRGAKAVVTTETTEPVSDNVYYYVAISNSTEFLDKTPPPGIPLQSSTTTIKVEAVPTGEVSVITEEFVEDGKTTTGFVTVTSTSTRLQTVTVANDSSSVSSEEAMRTPSFNVKLGSDGWNQTSIPATAGPTVAIPSMNISSPVDINNNNNTTTTVFIETVPGLTTTITQTLLWANKTSTALMANPSLSVNVKLVVNETVANNNASNTSTSISAGPSSGISSGTDSGNHSSNTTTNASAGTSSDSSAGTGGNNPSSTTTSTSAGTSSGTSSGMGVSMGIGVNGTQGVLLKRTVLQPTALVTMG